MKKKQVMKIIGAAVLVAVIGGTVVFTSNRGMKVTEEKLQNGSVVQTVEAEGHIETETEKVYYAGVSAPIETFSLKAGDMVTKGDLLVSYDTEDYERNVEQARFQAQALQNGYEGSVAQSHELNAAYQGAATQDAAYKEAYEATLHNVNQLQYNIEVVSDFVDDQARDIQEEIAQVKIDIAQKEAQAADYDDDDRYDYAEQAAQLRIKLARLEKELEELPKTGAKPDENLYFNEAKMYMSEVNTQRSMLQQEMLSTKHAAMNASQLQQLADEVSLANTTLQWNEEEAQKASAGIQSDITGVISDVAIEEGIYVAEGTKLFTLKDTEHVKAVVEVTSREMGQIAVGQEAVVEIAGKEYEGVVSKIRMEAVTDSEDKAKIQVEIHIKNPDSGIYLGTDVDVTINTGTSENALTIPNQALYTDDEGDYCYVSQNGVIEKRYLTCGLTDGDKTEVLEGLTGQETVITSAMTDENIGKKVAR